MQQSMRLCEWCSALYVPVRVTSRTCSKRCRALINRAEQYAKHRSAHLLVECEGCGLSFPQPRSDSRHCSVRCRNVVIARGVRAARLATRPPKRCATCGKDITHLRADALTCPGSCRTMHYRSTRRDQFVVHQQNREAAKRRATVGYGVPQHEWDRVLRRAAGRCNYCSERRPLTMDHVVPISRGGAHSIGNVVAACGSCNSSKGSSLLVEWRKEVVAYGRRRDRAPRSRSTLEGVLGERQGA